MVHRVDGPLGVYRGRDEDGVYRNFGDAVHEVLSEVEVTDDNGHVRALRVMFKTRG